MEQHFNPSLREARDDAGLTQQQALVRLYADFGYEVTPSMLSRAEKGTAELQPYIVAALASLYGVPLDEWAPWAAEMLAPVVSLVPSGDLGVRPSTWINESVAPTLADAA